MKPTKASRRARITDLPRYKRTARLVLAALADVQNNNKPISVKNLVAYISREFHVHVKEFRDLVPHCITKGVSFGAIRKTKGMYVLGVALSGNSNRTPALQNESTFGEVVRSVSTTRGSSVSLGASPSTSNRGQGGRVRKQTIQRGHQRAMSQHLSMFAIDSQDYEPSSMMAKEEPSSSSQSQDDLSNANSPLNSS